MIQLMWKKLTENIVLMTGKITGALLAGGSANDSRGGVFHQLVSHG